MSMKVHFDAHLFQQALREYQSATHKDMVEVLNRAGRNVAYRAAQFTPAATAARIRSDLEGDGHLKYALTSIALKAKGIGTLQSPLFANEVRRLVARRVASRTFLRSGWAPAIQALGGSYRGRKMGQHGRATKATVHRLVTEIVNTVPGIERMGVVALQGAINYVAEDMLDYANSLMFKRAQAHSY